MTYQYTGIDYLTDNDKVTIQKLIDLWLAKNEENDKKHAQLKNIQIDLYNSINKFRAEKLPEDDKKRVYDFIDAELAFI